MAPDVLVLGIPEVENPGLFGPVFDLPAGFNLSGLDPSNRRLLAETLGEGEVSIRMNGVPAIAAQEWVFAGLWVLKGAGVDRAEVAPVPTLARDRAFAARCRSPGKAHCYDCGGTVEIEHRFAPCPDCGGGRLMPVSGDEMRIRDAEIA
jgi:hypothetical protein